ncbi:hypothetical protein Pint_01714 [Pistacia integerrima]|uniref:Uncharacterized protein n=1 Tax=Pistacia integerrima TaxID=434235 RepID=A0ACC0ZHH3_9ROSI|nr:hypothetical protein Pint_01714 [Pistacia integerrima]
MAVNSTEEVAKLNATEWYFFSFRDRKYATGFRTNRATTSGYWKATGKDRTVLDPATRELVGMRKTLVFYRNRAPNGIKTGWIMHEFRLETPHMPPKEDWVLCRVFHKSKGENSNKLSPEFIFDTTANASSLNSAVSPATDRSIPFGYQPTPLYQNHCPTNSMLNLLHFSQEKNTSHSSEISTKGEHNDDEYGFIWDMELQGNSLEDHGVPSNLEDMRFEMDNNMAFL